MEGYSPDIAENLRKQLEAIAPEAFVDGKLDVEALKRALGEEHVLEQGERYHLDWPGKSAAYKVLQEPTSATLRPQPELSVNFDTAEHVFIEGENLEVLKALQKAYFGKIKLIYIDPPYNTGSDSFIYPDKFQESKSSYLQRINALNDEGQLLREGFYRKNSKESGHYHSNWLNMMLPRLYLARNLLREDGVIFVSIDDNEVHNLRCIMNEVFGEENFVASVVWRKKISPDARQDIDPTHEYIVIYCKSSNDLAIQGTFGIIPLSDNRKKSFKNPDNDPRGEWASVDMTGMTARATKEQFFKVTLPSGRIIGPPTGRSWGVAQATFEKLSRDGRIWFGKDGDGVPRIKRYLSEAEGQNSATWWSEAESGTTETARKAFESIIKKPNIFDFPKPLELIQRILLLLNDPSALVLDFFSGSGTTAQAVLSQNMIDSGKRQFICVQLPEKCPLDSEPYKEGFKNIADIARERIRRVIQKIQDEADLVSPAPDNLGFKSFVLSSSNFKQWRGDGIETEEQLAEQLELFVRSEKDGADFQNMLYELILKAGFPLTTSLERLSVSDSPVYSVNEGQLLLVLEAFHFDMIELLVAMKPKEILCLDTVFQNNDELKTNLDLQCRDAGVIFTCI